MLLAGYGFGGQAAGVPGRDAVCAPRRGGGVEHVVGPMLSVDAARDYRDAAMIYRAIRRRGHTVPKLMDCLIATVAARTGAILVHRDRDFDVLASCLPELRVRSLG